MLFLGEWLTEVSLAFWIRGDGYGHQNCVVLCTECFTKEEVTNLQILLQKKFKLKTYLRKDYIQARVWKNDRLSFSKGKNI